MKRKVFPASGYHSYCNWLDPVGFETTNNPDDADLLLLGGGTDVNPKIYNQRRGKYTESPDEPRDAFEIELYKKFNESKKPIVSICRGSQLVCALQPGGALIQDIEHPHRHTIKTHDGRKIVSNSLHHQMCLLDGIDPKTYELVAWTERLSDRHLNENDRDYGFGEDFKEPEIFVTNGNQLNFQLHPEMHHPDEPIGRYCRELVEKYILTS